MPLMTPRDILKLTNNYSISEITVSLIAEPVGEIVYITSIDTSTQAIRSRSLQGGLLPTIHAGRVQTLR